MKKITLLLTICLLGSCNKTTRQASPVNNIPLEELAPPGNEDWRDVTLKIMQETKTDSTHIYTVKALYKKDTVGFKLEVRSNINAGLGNGAPSGNGFVANGATFIPIGKESNSFITALAELYGYPKNLKFNKPVAVTAFNLNETAVDLDKKSYYKLKIFFEGEDEDDYAEAYLNINTETKMVEFFEKDPEYRENILHIFSKP